MDVGDIAEIGLAFADRKRLSAGFVDKLAEIDGAAELLAVPAVVGKQDIRAEFELVPPVDGGEGIADLILAVDQQRRLRGAGGEGADTRDGHLVLRAVDHGVELGDGRGQLELEAQVVDDGRAQHGSFAELFGIRAAAEYAVHRRQVVAADGAVGIGVVEAIHVTAEEQVVVLVDLVVEAKEGRAIRGSGR